MKVEYFEFIERFSSTINALLVRSKGAINRKYGRNIINTLPGTNSLVALALNVPHDPSYRSMLA